MAGGTSPTVRRWELGALLRELRHEAGLSVEDVARHLLCSQAKVSRMETGQRAATLRDVRDLSTLYKVPEEQQQRLMSLAREARQEAWWQKYDVPYTTFIGLEAAAVSISCYELGFVPGLLQVEPYARAALRGQLPNASSSAIQDRVEVRMGRQELLSRDEPPDLWFVLDESVLRREVGGTKVMRDQVAHLIEVSRLPSVTLQVIPFGKGAHLGMIGSFVTLAFAEKLLSDVTYIEGLTGDQYLDREADVARYRHAFNHLRATADSPSESRRFLEQVVTDWQRA